MQPIYVIYNMFKTWNIIGSRRRNYMLPNGNIIDYYTVIFLQTPNIKVILSCS